MVYPQLKSCSHEVVPPHLQGIHYVLWWEIPLWTRKQGYIMHADMTKINLLSTFVLGLKSHSFSANTWLDQHTLFWMFDVDPPSHLITCW